MNIWTNLRIQFIIISLIRGSNISYGIITTKNRIWKIINVLNEKILKVLSCLSRMRRRKSTGRTFSRIQNSTRDYFDSSYHKSASEKEYFKMITEKKIVACYKCRMEIRIGEDYETNHKYGRGNSRKYYHKKCYESLYHWHET